MDERIFPSKTGMDTACAGNISLHSSYDPLKEAERYVESLNIKNNVTHFILLEPALAYIIPVLRKTFPQATFLTLRSSSFFRGKGNPDAEWFYGNNETLLSFLEHHISDSDISRVNIIEWRPSLDAYGETYSSLLYELRVFIERAAANIKTTRFFGPRWIQNCLKNLSALENVLTFKKGTCPVLVCGAGPSLEAAIPIIKQFQNDEALFIIAVSSSFLALKERGINPHLVIGSDGGNWARLHFIECERYSLQHDFFCATLNAALPSQCGEHPVLILSDCSTWQSVLLEKYTVPHMRFPQRGTVTASALDIALQITSGKVFVSGIDLSEDDLRSHARPYAFDILLSSKANRCNPYYSETFKRKAREKSGALTIYADWFRHYLENYPGRIYSMGKNHEIFSSLCEDLISNTSCKSLLPEFTVVGLNKRNQSPLEILFQVIDNQNVKEELGELLSIDETQKDMTTVLKEKLSSLWKQETNHG
ncbi:MAG: DUF115 domain-containing protein [Treponema sp.]|jgi:hypothetical protein|nr:DUF115 domain-containing protein [Treponema sp.]